MSGITRAKGALIYSIAFLPLFWAAGVIGLAVRARGYLGYWPAPYYPDPQFLPFDLHYAILFFSAYVVLCSLLILPGLRIFRRHLIPPSSWHRASITFASGWLLIVILTFVPPINFVTWYLD